MEQHKKNHRPFGCDAHAHVPKNERHKLEPKATKCVLLGYGSQRKGYCLYDSSSGKVIYSRNVIFDELQMHGIQKEQTEKSDEKYVDLKIDNKGDVEELVKVLETNATVTEIHDNQVINRHEPDRYGNPVVFMATDDLNDPVTSAEALSSPEKAMEREMDSLRSKNY